MNGQQDTLAGLRRDRGALQAQRQTAEADFGNKMDTITPGEKPGG